MTALTVFCVDSLDDQMQDNERKSREFSFETIGIISKQYQFPSDNISIDQVHTLTIVKN